MVRNVSIPISESAYRSLLQRSQDSGQSIESILQRWIEWHLPILESDRAPAGDEPDPILPLIGCLDIGRPIAESNEEIDRLLAAEYADDHSEMDS